MRVLVTGGAGLLGRHLIAAAPRGIEVHATQRRSPVDRVPAHVLDLADAGAVKSLYARLRPVLVLHTAYGVDDGDHDIVAATRNVAQAARQFGTALVHISSDVVFDGENAPYAEHDRLAPVNRYGRWKAQAERDVRALVPLAAVVRTSLIVAVDPWDPASERLAAALRNGRPPSLFVDELRCPILVDDLATQLWQLAALPEDRRAGPWHLAGPEALSRYTVGLLIGAREGLAVWPRPAWNREHREPRPRDLRLRTQRADELLGHRAKPLSDALATRGRAPLTGD